MIKRAIRYIVIVFVLLVLIIGIWVQVSFEKYTSNQIDEYGILDKRERISHKPVILFLIHRNLFGYNKYSTLMHVPYRDINQAYRVMIKDEYIIECYYSDTEKNKLLELGDSINYLPRFFPSTTPEDTSSN
jgi:hypothetical protein